MADKDILEKVLMSYADVFADCENVLVYGGMGIVHAADLQPAPTESFYRSRKRLHNQFCDVSFYMVKNGEIKKQFTGDARFSSLIDQMLSKQKEGEEIVMCDYIDMLEARGQARGEAIGQARGETMLASLLAKLYSLGRDEDAKLAVRDEIFRKRLYQEFCIVS